MTIRLIRHEATANCGSFEVRFSDGRVSQFFYWDDKPGRRVQPDQLTSEEALKQAREFAQAMRRPA
jgi:hypothetical protein